MWFDAYVKKSMKSCLLFETHLFKMRLNAEQESFRKRLEIFFVKNPNIKKCDIVNHCEK